MRIGYNGACTAYGGFGPLKRRAFTLIELLVVIAIIGIIIAILLPALSGARERSWTVLCQSRLRSIGAGWHMYADDHDDVSPPGRLYNKGGGVSNPANWYDVGNGLAYRPRWIAMIGKYVGIYAYDMPRADVDRLDYTNNVYLCPTVPLWTDNRNSAYGYNHQFLGNSRQAAGRFINFPVNRSSISSFAGTVMAADCMGTAAGVPASDRQEYSLRGTGFNEMGNHGWTLDPPKLTATSDRGTGDPGTPRTAVDPRHQTKANAVFCDGHVDSVLPRTIGYRVLPNGAFVDLESTPDGPNNTWFSGSSRDLDPPALPTKSPAP